MNKEQTEKTIKELHQKALECAQAGGSGVLLKERLATYAQLPQTLRSRHAQKMLSYSDPITFTN